ncbi:MAG TPA: DUF6252 family protein [Flavobacterium sp.]|jgi:hypothetical protein
MKILSTFSLLALSTFLFSCSSSDSDNNNEETPNFAMTAKINNVVFEANNPFGGNDFSTTNIWDYFPEEDYVMLQARQGGILGNPEINLWLKRSDIAEGTYTIGQESFSTPPSHFIDLNDLSNDISEYTKSGVIVITDVDTSTKIVKGTFQFETVDELDNTTADINVTNGTFNYKYE